MGEHKMPYLLSECFASQWIMKVVGGWITADCSMPQRSVTPNMMIPRRPQSVKPARQASVEHRGVSSRPITPATGRQSQMIGIALHTTTNAAAATFIFIAHQHTDAQY